MSGALAGLLAGAAVVLATAPTAASRLRRCLPASGSPRPDPDGRCSSGSGASDRSGLAAPVTGRRRRRAQGPEPVQMPVPVVIDLVAAVVEAGSPPSRAVRLVSRCLSGGGDPSGEALLSPQTARPAWRPLFEALDLAGSCGLGPVGLLRSAAGEQRRRRAESLAVAARRLAVLAVLPTALCLLPAFVVLTVIPLVLDLLFAR